MRTLRLVTPARHSLGRALLAGGIIWSLPPLTLFFFETQEGIALFWAAATGLFVLPASLLILWPLDGFLPRTSRLWHPGGMAIIGGFSGFLFMAIFFAFTQPGLILQAQFWLACLLSGGTYGTFMGITLALLNRRK